MFVKTEGGYSALDFPGTPAEFKNAAQSALGEPADILFGEGEARLIGLRLCVIGTENQASPLHIIAPLSHSRAQCGNGILGQYVP